MILSVLLVSTIPTAKAQPYAYEEDGNDTIGWAWGDYEEGGESISSEAGSIIFEGEGDSSNDVDYVHTNEPSAIDWESGIFGVIRYKMSSLLADSIDLYMLNHTYVDSTASPTCYLTLDLSISWVVKIFNIDDCSASGSPIGNIEAIVFRFQADLTVDVDFHVDYIRFDIDPWDLVDEAEFVFPVGWDPVSQFGFDMFFIALGLIMIPFSTLYLVRGGIKKMTRDKLFYGLIIFVMGFGLLIGGIMP